MRKMKEINENGTDKQAKYVAKSQSKSLESQKKEKGKEEKQREIRYESIPDSQSC